MSHGTWRGRLGPPLLLLVALAGGVLAMARLLGSVDAGPGVPLASIAACEARPAVAPGNARPGAWWKLSSRISGAGVLTGRQLFVGQGNAPAASVDLGPESAAAGPIDGVVLVTSDDGLRSSIRLVRTSDGCSWQLHDSTSVARGAALDPADGSAFVHFVDRSTRTDLGTWRVGRAGDPADGRLVVPAIGPLPAGFGPVFVTELRLDGGARRLAVQSCGDHGCVSRVVRVDQPSATTDWVLGVDQGTIIGFSRDRLVTWSACQAPPCSVLEWTTGSNSPRVLVDAARSAAITADGGFLVAIEGSAHAIRVDLETGARRGIRGVRDGELALGGGAGAFAGLEVRAGEVALGSASTELRAFNPTAAEVAP